MLFICLKRLLCAVCLTICLKLFIVIKCIFMCSRVQLTVRVVHNISTAQDTHPTITMCLNTICSIPLLLRSTRKMSEHNGSTLNSSRNWIENKIIGIMVLVSRILPFFFCFLSRIYGFSLTLNIGNLPIMWKMLFDFWLVCWMMNGSQLSILNWAFVKYMIFLFIILVWFSFHE